MLGRGGWGNHTHIMKLRVKRNQKPQTHSQSQKKKQKTFCFGKRCGNDRGWGEGYIFSPSQQASHHGAEPGGWRERERERDHPRVDFQMMIKRIPIPTRTWVVWGNTDTNMNLLHHVLQPHEEDDTPGGATNHHCHNHLVTSNLSNDGREFPTRLLDVHANLD